MRDDEFMDKKVVEKYDVRVPYCLGRPDLHGWWGTWEKCRFDSMEANLKKGDILFDVGAEVGWISAIYAKYFVGAENMVMFEPVPNNWSMIKRVWREMGLATPLAMRCALVGAETTMPAAIDYDNTLLEDGWPAVSNVDLFLGRNFRYIHEHGYRTAQITIDDFVSETKITPDAITIDIEGAELLALKGAEKTLVTFSPKVWVSLHPDLMERDYPPTKPQDVLDFMGRLGYSRVLLGFDHEEHNYFEKRPA